jgi:DNA-binding CsgD family transcriptional regulator
VQAELAFRSSQAALLEVLDTLRRPVLVGNISGKVVHQTPALRSMLEVEPDRDRLRSALEDLLSRAATLARASNPSACEGALQILNGRVGCYHARVCFYGLSGLVSRPLVIIALEPVGPPLIRGEELRERFGLTVSQVRVAILIARGKPNVEIARELFISPHTAKRHTEHVLQKLGARTRAEVAALVMGTMGSDGTER